MQTAGKQTPALRFRLQTSDHPADRYAIFVSDPANSVIKCENAGEVPRSGTAKASRQRFSHE